MTRSKLNERQLNVLRRICHGQTPVTSADSSLAATVYALRNRGLVTTTWADGRWSAAPTEAGRQHLAETDSEPAPRSNASVSPIGTEAAVLITKIQQSGGTLRITSPTPDERARFRRALHAARADHLIPDGYHLQYTGRDKGDLTITLHPGLPPTRGTPATDTIHVPDTLPEERLHPVARDAPVPICPDCQPRARRILHALCLAAEDKDWSGSIPVPESRASLVISAADATFPLYFREGSYEVPDPSGVKYAWQRVTARTTRPSHQLELSLEHSYAYPGRQYHWGDRQRWRLEDKLPALLAEITHRANTEHERRLARQRKEEETRERWLAAMKRARTALIEDHRLQTLRAQIHAWQEAAAIRSYCCALEDHQATIPDPADDVAPWIAWARAYADRIDPVRQLPGPPADPNITPEDLRPYLHGWSPYEPKRA